MLDSDLGCCGRSGTVYLVSPGGHVYYNKVHIALKDKQFLLFVCPSCHSTQSTMWKVSTRLRLSQWGKKTNRRRFRAAVLFSVRNLLRRGIRKALDKVEINFKNESVNGHLKGKGTASLECSHVKEATQKGLWNSSPRLFKKIQQLCPLDCQEHISHMSGRYELIFFMTFCQI